MQMTSVIVLSRLEAKSSKLAVPYILGVEVGFGAKRSFAESGESYKQFSQKIPHMPTNSVVRQASRTHDLLSSKPIFAFLFPPPQVRNLCAVL